MSDTRNPADGFRTTPSQPTVLLIPMMVTQARAGGDPSTWFVVERPIPREEWVEAIETATGAILALDLPALAVSA